MIPAAVVAAVELTYHLALEPGKKNGFVADFVDCWLRKEIVADLAHSLFPAYAYVASVVVLDFDWSGLDAFDLQEGMEYKKDIVLGQCQNLS